MANFSKVDEYIYRHLHQECSVPSCDVLICRDHEILHRYSCGWNDYAHTVPVNGRELYDMYSCTKPVTVTAAMRLVEEGKLALDAPVSNYLPEWKDAYLLEDGKRVAPRRAATIRHLFTMSAGLDYNFSKEPILEVIRESDGSASTREIVCSFVQSPLCFHPGEAYRYSLCHDVLAAVIEVVTGMKYSEYLAKIIFEPLGMHDATFHPTDAQKARHIAKYRPEDGKVIPDDQPNRYVLAKNYESGGAGLVTSVHDYAKFADTLACGGKSADGYRLLKPETIDLMRTEQFSAFPCSISFQCAAGPGYGYGLGVRTMVDRSQGQRSSIGEFGWDGAAGSYVMIDPAQRLSITFGMHVRQWPSVIGCGHAPIRDLTYEALGL